MPLTPGSRLGPYEIVSPLGAGGMGEVYRARDTRLDRDVAIKVLPAGLLSDEASRSRFRKEAKALSRLSHPHVATLLDFGSADGTDYLVMELVPGLTLALAGCSAGRPIARGRGSPNGQAVEVATQELVEDRSSDPEQPVRRPSGVLVQPPARGA